MADYEKFLPEYTPLHEPFWSALRQHRVDLQRCDRCRRFRFIPTEACSCGSAEYTWEPIAGTGEVYTYTVVHRAPTPAYQADVPYVIAHVTMDEGPRMISNLVDCNPASVAIGMPVEVVFDDVTPEVTLYRFRPRTSG
jgi:uncharacterized OB-fold protein